MSRVLLSVAVSALLLTAARAQEPAVKDSGEKLQYHTIKTDAAGKILPWPAPNAGQSYDQING